MLLAFFLAWRDEHKSKLALMDFGLPKLSGSIDQAAVLKLPEGFTESYCGLQSAILGRLALLTAIGWSLIRPMALVSICRWRPLRKTSSLETWGRLRQWTQATGPYTIRRLNSRFQGAEPAGAWCFPEQIFRWRISLC